MQQLFIDGVWRAGSDGVTRTIINPATEEPVACVACASAQDIDAALDAADRARAAWLAIGGDARAEILQRAADALAADHEDAAIALTRQQGKTLAESRAEYARVIETLAWHANAAGDALAPRPAGCATSATILPEPIGVVAAFIPWNYPAVIAARKIGAALAAGCTLVLKGAEEAPDAAAHIVRALEAAGLPRGVVNLVFGDPPAISAQVLDSPVVRAFTFTGSTTVGKQLAARAARRLTRCVLELGGHAPVLVFADADLDAAAHAIAAYKWECAGQSCNAPSRIYVERACFEPFLARFTAIARAVRVGDGSDPSTTMGPLANPRRLAALRRLVDDAVARGARITIGGERLPRRGYFWPPTILTGVPDDAAMMIEEPFGPLVAIAPFDTFDEAIARANANPYGLAAYVFTAPASKERMASASNELTASTSNEPAASIRNVPPGSTRNAPSSSNETASTAARGLAAARALAAGSVGINELRGVPPDVGIAGIKDSGYGYEGGQPGIDAFLNLKVVRGSLGLGLSVACSRAPVPAIATPLRRGIAWRGLA